MLTITKVFLKSGKPSKSALELAEYVKEALALKKIGAVRLYLKTYGKRGNVNQGEHVVACFLLVDAGIEYDEGNDSWRGDKIGDYIELERAEARKFLRMIEKAAA